MCRQFFFLVLVLIVSLQGRVQSFQQQLLITQLVGKRRDAAKPKALVLAHSSDSGSSGTTPEPVYLSPNHIATLRKEAAKRIANKRISVVFVPEDGTEFTDDSLALLTDALKSDELVQVRGLSRNNKKQIRAIAESLTQELSLAMHRDVNLVECKGHAAIYYCPFDNDNDSVTNTKRIKLFTSVGKKNEWTKKPKPVRDNRGQIIPGLYE